MGKQTVYTDVSQGGKMARMVIDGIDNDLYRKLRLRAAEKGVTLKALIIEAIEKIVGGEK